MGVRIYSVSPQQANWFIKECGDVMNGAIGYVFNQFLEDPERLVPQFAAGVQAATIRTKSGGASC